MCGVGSVFVTVEVEGVETRPSTALRAVLRTRGFDLPELSLHRHTGGGQYPVFKHRSGFRVKPGMTDLRVLSSNCFGLPEL